MRYKQDIILRYNDFDQYDIIKPYVYLSLFQDVAGRHTDYLKCGYQEMKDQHIAWLLMKHEVVFLRDVSVNDVLTVSTWASSHSRMDFIRDYEITLADGTVVARGVSQWIIADFVTHRILRTEEVRINWDIEEKSNFGKVDRLSSIDYHNLTHQSTYKIDEDDLDHYGHTNNVQYAKMIYKAITKEQIKIKSLKINYHNEAKLGSTVEIYCQREDSKIKGCGVIKDSEIRSFDFEIGF